MKANRAPFILAAILLLGAGLRLIGIGNPLIGHHSWRQADTAAVARNFVEEQFSLLNPRIDWRGTTSGEVECEFPVYQFAVASLYRVFGVNEMAGRLLSIALSLSAVLGMYFLAKRIAGVAVGLWSALFLATLPMPTFFGRAMMPESLLLAACVFSVLLFLKWTESDSRGTLLLSALCLAVACLLKPPTLYLGLPLAYLAFRKGGWKAAARPELWAYGILIFAALALWYGHAYGIKRSTGLTFGVWEYGSDKWGNWDLVRSGSFWYLIFAKRIPHILLSYVGLPLLIIGLWRPSRGDAERVFSLWLVGIFVLVVVVAKGVFEHDYYLLPASIPAAYFMAKAATWGTEPSSSVPRWGRVCMALCVLATLAVSFDTYVTWLRKEKPLESAAFQLAQMADRVLPRDSLVIAVDKGDPMILYYSHRKGWGSFPRYLSEGWLDARRKEGARYVLGVHKDFLDDGSSPNLARLLDQYTTITNNGSFFIVTTRRRTSGNPSR